MTEQVTKKINRIDSNESELLRGEGETEKGAMADAKYLSFRFWREKKRKMTNPFNEQNRI